MASVPILTGIDLASNELNCAFAEGEPMAGTDGSPTLMVNEVWVRERAAGEKALSRQRRKTPKVKKVAWALAPVEEYLNDLVARCEREDRRAMVAVDVPFGYPERFCRYALDPLERVKDDAGSDDKTNAGKNPIDSHLYRVCELRLMDELQYEKRSMKRRPEFPHRALWEYYAGLRKYRSKKGVPSPGWRTKPLCSVGSWLSVTIIKWVRLCSELNVVVQAPSVWSLGERVLLFEFYPVATQVLSGLWHPRLKADKNDCVTRCDAKALLTSGKVKVDAAKPAADLRPWWGSIRLGEQDVTSTDHRFDALTGLLTAWWLGRQLPNGLGSARTADYPSPEKIKVHPDSIRPLPVTEGRGIVGGASGEGSIYYPAIPEALLLSKGETA
jgi:hypothetical protein